MDKAYIVDRGLHWISALLLILMLLTLSAELHTVDWDVKGQIAHRQEAVQQHAAMAFVLALVLVFRLVWSARFSTSLPRLQPKSPLHHYLVKVSHASLYFSITVMFVTGALMALTYDLPLSVFGAALGDEPQKYIDTFPQLREIHLFTQSLVGWLIVLHVAGAVYSRR